MQLEVDPEQEKDYLDQYDSEEEKKKSKKKKGIKTLKNVNKPDEVVNIIDSNTKNITQETENNNLKKVQNISKSIDMTGNKQKDNITPKNTVEDVTIDKTNIEDSTIKQDDELSKDKDKKSKKKSKKPEDKKTSKKVEGGGGAEKKKMGKTQLAALKEALRKKEEQEALFIKQQEERFSKEEEAEANRLEKIRLAEERKMKKKLKEKEKKERLKQEGKLLTKAQKQAKMRAEAMLEAFKAQGFELPDKADGANATKPKRVIYDDRKKKKNISGLIGEEKGETFEEGKVRVENVSENMKESSDEEEIESSSEGDESDADLEKDVKINWDESSGPTSENSSTDDDSDSGSDFEKVQLEKGETPESGEHAVNHVAHKQETEEMPESMVLRSPVVCIMGHVDTGKTKILDKLRKTNVQENEAGGITQQIGATNVPQQAIIEQAKHVKGFSVADLLIPGLLIIDTPGHESFKNLRNRGSSLCDIAVLVVDIMHGMEPQTLESLKTLMGKEIPFLIALNKIDRLHQWKNMPTVDVEEAIKSQNRNILIEFNDRVRNIIVQFAEQCVNVALYYENLDRNEFVSMVPVSAHSGDGMGNLMEQIVYIAQTKLLQRLRFSPSLLQCSVLEVKELTGMGTTLDVILVNGKLCEGDTIVLAGIEGAISTQIRGLMMPQPLKDLRVKNLYEKHKEVCGAIGVKIIGKDLDNALPGFPIYLAKHPGEIEKLKEDINNQIQDTLQSIKLSDLGVYVQASTIGSLEALLEFLRTSKIPYAGINIGPVHRKDVMKSAAMLEHKIQYAVILAFDVKIDKDAQEIAESLGVKIFAADIIYHLFDKFTQYQEEFKLKRKEEHKESVVFPCRLKILPQFIFKTRDPIIVGVTVLDGDLRIGTPLCVPDKEDLYIGNVSSIEFNHKNMDVVKKGQEVCIKIDNLPGETPKLYGRHFDHNDILISRINRQSIDVLKEYFRDEMQKSDWQLIVELKKMLKII